MERTLEDQERHLLVKIIDRILYKLDDLVRPYVHKILVVIEPLLIDEDYYARVEGREIISNLSKAAGLAHMISTMRPDIDHVDEYVRNTTARAFSVVASALGIPALLPFLKAVCRSKKSWQARHTGVKIVQQIAILMGCAILPHLTSLVDAIGGGLEDEQQKVRIITALAIAALAEAAAPYGFESFDIVLRPLWKGVQKHRGKGLAAFLKATGYIIPLMDAEYANHYTTQIMRILIREFQSPDEEMKKIVLKVVSQSAATDGVDSAYLRAEVMPEFFKNFWVRRMALDRRNYRQVVETTVELAQKVGVTEIIEKIVDHLKDESEPYRKMAVETIEKIIAGLGAADINTRLEERLIDGVLYAFQEQSMEDVVMLNGFGTVVNALGEEYPEVLGSILGALKSIVNVVGMTSMTPPIKDLLPRLTPILRNRHEKVQENTIDLVGRIADRGSEFVSAREWMRICFELLDMLKAHKKGIRRAAVNTFGFIAKAIGPQDVLATLLNNLKVQERQNRVCTTVAIAIVAETCAPFTVLPAVMNEYRVPELNVQNGVLKSLSFLFEYIGEMGKDYIYAVVPLLCDALTDRDQVHRQTAATTVSHLALGVVGLGCEDAMIHLLNTVWPNIFEQSPHLINAVINAIDGIRTAIGPGILMMYILQGLFHPSRKVRDVYWRLYNNMYVQQADSMVPYYPNIENDEFSLFFRHEMQIWEIMGRKKSNEHVEIFQYSKHPFLLSPEQIEKELSTSMENGLQTKDVEERLLKYGDNSLNSDNNVSVIAVLIRQAANAMTLVNALRSLSSPTAHVIREGSNFTVPSSQIVLGDIVELKMGDTVPADIRLFEAMNFETDESLFTGESLPVSKSVNANFDSEDVSIGDRVTMAWSVTTVTKGRAKGIVVFTGVRTEVGAISESFNRNKSRRRIVKKNEGKVAFYAYIIAFWMTVLDGIGRFLGVNIGTPLQKKLSALAICLFGIALLFALIVFAANRFVAKDEVVLYAIATGLSMIPSSLVVVLTITMAVGTKRMVKRHVIVRKLDSLEALGAITDICSDKTGTLTQGKMSVRQVWVYGLGIFLVSENNEPLNPTLGTVTFVKVNSINYSNDFEETEKIDPKTFSISEELNGFLNIASLANLAIIHQDDEKNWKATGEPTDIALQVFACRFDYGRSKLLKGDDPLWTQLAEFPFDSDVKRMSVVFRKNTEEKLTMVFMKGATERVLAACTVIGVDRKSLTQEDKEEVLKNMNVFSNQGLRVVALAQKQWTRDVHNWESVSRDDVESDLSLMGFVGIYDPPRPESGASVKRIARFLVICINSCIECHQAGINVHMLTGDHVGTAKAIAMEIGILPQNMSKFSDNVSYMIMTASQFDRMSDSEIDSLPQLPLVIARCAPQTKVRMIEALHRRKAFCAMTGDGVNDSPSLKRADVGIAMGMSGSDVTKNASDIVLTDDNFASIINAIEEGRRMFDNIKKFVLHLLAANVAQALYLLIGLVFQDRSGFSVFALTPVEILWIIMVTSAFPAMGLGMEAASSDIMKRPPHNIKVGVFTWEVVVDTFVYGFIQAIICLVSYVIVVWGYGNGNLGVFCNDFYNPSCEYVYRGRSTTFVELTWMILILAWEMIDLRQSMFFFDSESPHKYTQLYHHLKKNKLLLWSVVLGFVSVFPVIYIPVINKGVFKHSQITWEWILAFSGLLLFIIGSELWKWAKRVYFRYHEKKVCNFVSDLEKNCPFEKYASIKKE
ncbi:hypothetical protein PORY_001616 [Pneumocystis oryctolagi]|uniref:Uncharacterized protein n=1 Tax=Pneumocystis oryctolagi TaxID=42067 RepID=A0ACB7CBE6_9ASCO|nr:hypothetical protein PORY_001616 [Pneumocystis oryctolagi]